MTTSGIRERAARLFRIKIKKVLFFLIIENLLLWDTPAEERAAGKKGLVFFWKKKIDRKRIKIMANLKVRIILYGFINIETSTELNYRSQDLAGLR